MALVVREHSPHSLRGILVSGLADTTGDAPEESSQGGRPPDHVDAGYR